MKIKTDWPMMFTLFGLFLIAELTVFTHEVRLSIWEFFVVALAASFAGRAIAYMRIGLIVRHLFVVEHQHPSGVGGYTEPRYKKGPLNAIGELLSCPLCSATWVGLCIVALWYWFPQHAYSLAQFLAIGSVASFVSRVHEAFEWMAASDWEKAGYYRKQTVDPDTIDENDVVANRYAEVKAEPGLLVSLEQVASRIKWENTK